MSIEVTEYKEKSEKIEAVFGEELMTIHHIGRTSVHDLKAKPLI